MASLIQWTWTWRNSRRWWGAGKPVVLQSMGLQRVGHNLATEHHHHANIKYTYILRVRFYLSHEQSKYWRTVVNLSCIYHWFPLCNFKRRTWKPTPVFMSLGNPMNIEPGELQFYLRLLIFLLAILIPVCVSFSPAFLMMYSTYKLNKQVTIYSLDSLLFLFETSLLFHVQFSLLLPDLYTGFSRGRSGGLVCPFLSEFSWEDWNATNL